MAEVHHLLLDTFRTLLYLVSLIGNIVITAASRRQTIVQTELKEYRSPNAWEKTAPIEACVLFTFRDVASPHESTNKTKQFKLMKRLLCVK